MAGNMGKPVPAAIGNSPILKQHDELYLYAFYDLDTERHSGMSIGPIPWSCVEHYALANDFDYEQRYTLHFVIRRMDAAHIKDVMKDTKKA